MDIYMPVMDGLEAARPIERAMPSVRIVMLTISPFHGVLAPRAAWRSQLIPGPQDAVDHEAAAEVARDGPGCPPMTG